MTGNDVLYYVGGLLVLAYDDGVKTVGAYANLSKREVLWYGRKRGYFYGRRQRAEGCWKRIQRIFKRHGLTLYVRGPPGSEPFWKPEPETDLMEFCDRAGIEWGKGHGIVNDIFYKMWGLYDKRGVRTVGDLLNVRKRQYLRWGLHHTGRQAEYSWLVTNRILGRYGFRLYGRRPTPSLHTNG